jgi:ribonuclease T2
MVMRQPMHARGLLALLALAAASVVACLAAPQALAQDRVQRGGPAGVFDFYVLALSWSPGFCVLEGDEKERDQCRAGSGLGFVVHGLWPQNERGYPIECGPAGRSPSRQAMDVARDVFPSDGLARHQWRKHGTCAGSSPTDYFADVKRAREAVVIPPGFQRVDRTQNWAPIDLERAFVAANPGLRTDMMSVACRRDAFYEVRICMSRDLRSFRPCEEVDRAGCRTRSVTVAPMR